VSAWRHGPLVCASGREQRRRPQASGSAEAPEAFGPRPADRTEVAARPRVSGRVRTTRCPSPAVPSHTQAAGHARTQVHGEAGVTWLHPGAVGTQGRRRPKLGARGGDGGKRTIRQHPRGPVRGGAREANGDGSGGRIRHCRGGRSPLAPPVFVQDIVAQVDAFVADVHSRSGDHLLDVLLRLPAEGAPQWARLAVKDGALVATVGADGVRRPAFRPPPHACALAAVPHFRPPSLHASGRGPRAGAPSPAAAATARYRRASQQRGRSQRRSRPAGSTARARPGRGGPARPAHGTASRRWSAPLVSVSAGADHTGSLRASSAYRRRRRRSQRSVTARRAPSPVIVRTPQRHGCHGEKVFLDRTDAEGSA